VDAEVETLAVQSPQSVCDEMGPEAVADQVHAGPTGLMEQVPEFVPELPHD
jgi:hypothetical protein